MGKALGITFGMLLATAIFLVYRTGYFKPVTIAAGEQGPFVLIYQVHKGPYHKIATVIDTVEALFKEKGTPCPLAFGRYLYDPNTVEHDRLESHGGCVFTNLTPDVEKIIKEKSYQMEAVEKKEYLVAHFEGSPSMGPMKVYPYVKEWLAKYGYTQEGPVIELYQTTGEDSIHTRYLFSYK